LLWHVEAMGLPLHVAPQRLSASGIGSPADITGGVHARLAFASRFFSVRSDRMTTPKAEQPSMLPRLTRYLALEADAVETYALAVCQLTDFDAVETVGEYRAQHEAQREELSRLVGDAGGEPFDAFRPRRPTTRERCVLGVCADDERRLAVLRDGEWARMIEYEAALRLQPAEPEEKGAPKRL
jgi:hypothetical protein